MKEWTEYVAEIAPLVPGCPNPIIAAEIRKSAERFCEGSLSWTDRLEDIAIVPEERDISLAGDVGDDATLIHMTWLGNEALGEISPRTVNELDRTVPGWRFLLETPRFYTMASRGDILWLAPHSSVPITLIAEVVLKPSPTSRGGPDDLWRDYRTAIQGGAIERLCGIPQKPWTNPKLQLEYRGYFNEGLAMALTKQSRGNTNRRARAQLNYRT